MAAAWVKAGRPKKRNGKRENADGHTSDSKIFVVNKFSLNLRFGLSDARKDKGLALVVSVSTDAQVHLVGVGASLEGLRDAQDGIWGTHGNIAPDGGGSADVLDNSLGSSHLFRLSLNLIFGG